MSDLSISNVVEISVSAANPGVNEYNTSNLGIVTGEPVASAVTTLAFSGVAASGAFVLKFGDTSTGSFSYNATIDAIQLDINEIEGLENLVVSGSIASKKLTFTLPGQLGAIPTLTVPTNTLQTAGSVNITTSVTVVSTGWSGLDLGYAMYVEPTSVGEDFGTDSITYKQALSVFSQQPNILANSGQLIVLLRDVTQQTVSFSAAPTGGDFKLVYLGEETANIHYNASASAVQAALRLVPGLEKVIVTGDIANEKLTVFFNGVYGEASALTATANTLVIGTVTVNITIVTTVAGESYGAAIDRTNSLVQYFGVMPNETISEIGEDDILEAAEIILPLRKIGFNVSYNLLDIEPGGIIDQFATGTLRNSRGLFYSDESDSAINCSRMMAAYAGRALSVNFSGSNTTITMNLKQLAGIQPDPNMTQTIWNEAKASGADIYVSYQGNSAVVSNGANSFFDQVYNLQWFVGALQVAGYNYLAQASTKVPQTEQGMDGLKGAYRNICNQAVINQYSAPGTWTSPTTFGTQALFLQNISQFGYYIYSQPISQQLATARAARQAPLVQIALKEAGAIQQSTVIVYVNP